MHKSTPGANKNPNPERRKLSLPLSRDTVCGLRAGDQLLLSGQLYTARDAAHARLIELDTRGAELPIKLAGETIYYTGPCPAPPGAIIGSAGPTTSGRMDRYTPRLLELGLRTMIGKGARDEQVIAAIKQYGAVYLGATGGAGALIAGCIVEAEIIAFPELGAEAIRRLTVKDMPVVVLIDAEGNDLYQAGRQKFAQPPTAKP
ncbi:MAG: Fe-S-containing hydro-lyase [Ruminococcaceae bacterium]|nr:Fe-S-containing hydro-lyase [Oscillospiraceae bacterium]